MVLWALLIMSIQWSPRLHPSLGFMAKPSMYMVPSPTLLASKTDLRALAKARASVTLSMSNSRAIFFCDMG